MSLFASKKVILNVSHFSHLSDLLSRKLCRALSRVRQSRAARNSVTEIKLKTFPSSLSQVFCRANELPLSKLTKLNFTNPLSFTNYRENLIISVSHCKFCRDNSDEPPVPHPDPALRGGQVPRGGERDPAVRDQRVQRQEEAHSAPHRVRGVRGAARHDQAHPAICPGACECRE